MLFFIDKMATKSINVTIDEAILAQSDAVVASGKYANRSRFIQESITYMLQKLDEENIAEQSRLLKGDEAEEWFDGELESWQEEY
ncbi:MAG: ribbon-helix-helix domain-containing protein [Pleurocapsa sp. MO_192.B19]|nr:ribbon-helix-helix domain-containing protein [Pleurocapsa sp. MO_192.B19]